MTEQQVKAYLSRYVLPQKNKSNEDILRTIIFTLGEINWQKAGELILKKHPEVTEEFLNDLVNGRII